MDIESDCVEEKNNHTDTAQKIKHTTNKKIKAKRASPITDPDCIYSYRTIPVSLAMVERMAEELMEWPAKNPTAKTITEFYLSKGLTQQTYNRLVNKYDFLKDAHEITMRRLGERLWGRAVDNDAAWKPVHFMLHNYAPEFKEATEYQHNLNKKTEGSHYQPFNVIIQETPNCNLVPEKRKVETEESFKE